MAQLDRAAALDPLLKTLERRAVRRNREALNDPGDRLQVPGECTSIWAKTQRRQSGYSDWTLGLLVRSEALSREDLRGMRWLAGKLLHFGPLPAVELKQWRDGEPPRWKWRPSRDVFPATRGERRSHDRSAYDRYLAGHDLIGTFNLFDALFAAEFLAWDLTGGSEA